MEFSVLEFKPTNQNKKLSKICLCHVHSSFVCDVQCTNMRIKIVCTLEDVFCMILHSMQRGPNVQFIWASLNRWLSLHFMDSSTLHCVTFRYRSVICAHVYDKQHNAHNAFAWVYVCLKNTCIQQKNTFKFSFSFCAS